MFDALLIANRGEIARRVAATARRLGIKSIAVYSDADAGARHVAEADAAVRLGPPAPGESYLRGDAILEAAVAMGAQAVHPGYGFLSENAAFAEACAARGVVFVGPPPDAIRAMGDKAASKRRMREAGVPLSPGYDGEEQGADHLAERAAEIGWPVMIKASAGGGGKGMRIVSASDQFAAALESCQREAAGAFGDDRVLIEKYIERPRHVEVQVFADQHGACVHLLDRDCSIQRRHQKVIEEAPAPDLPAETAAAMRAAAVRAAEAVGYVGAGTVEFLLGADGAFYFMEMNTRLQVEHPATEAVLGLDLVEWQLRVAAGEALPLDQAAIEAQARGHGIEARLYAEDPDADFLPSTGRLTHLAFPPHVAFRHSAGLRVDAGVVEGDVVSPHYDPMIAKLIAYGPDRASALRALRRSLEGTRVVGLASNREFLLRLTRLEDVSAPRLDTGLIARNAEDLAAPEGAAPGSALLAAALFEAAPDAEAPPPIVPFDATDGWRLAGPARRRLTYLDGAVERVVSLANLGPDPDARGALAWRVGDADGPLVSAKKVGGRIDMASSDGVRAIAHVVRDGAGARRQVFLDGARWTFEHVDPLAASAADETDVGDLRAPMPGKIVRLFAQSGDIVARGDPLIVIEAMKMEHTIVAPIDGAASLLVALGDQVSEGEALAEVAAV